MTDPKRLLLAGDIHGASSGGIPQLAYLIRVACDTNCDAIVQIGDFGFFWPGQASWKMAERMLDQAGIPLYFIDGNHEDFGLLKSIGAFGSDRMTAVTSHITYVPRGLIWKWNRKSIMAMGGGVSIDKESRIDGRSWWREETVTYADMDRAATNLESHGGRVDLLLTHDCPEGVEKLELFLDVNGAGGFKADEESRAHRRTLRMLVDGARPRMIVHGHYHWSYEDVLTIADGSAVSVFGLGCDGMSEGSWMVLELG